MAIPSCECNAGLPTRNQLANIYCALLDVIAGQADPVVYPLSPTLGGTGVANLAGETITLNGGFALQLTLTGATNVTLPTSGTIQVFDQSLNTVDGATFSSVSAGGSVLNGDLLTGLVNGLTITNNSTNTLNIGAGATLAAVYSWTFDNTNGLETVVNSGGGSAPGTTAFGVPTLVFGDLAAGVLAGPVRWIVMVVDGEQLRIPAYSA